jgi:hypothetical protein
MENHGSEYAWAQWSSGGAITKSLLPRSIPKREMIKPLVTEQIDGSAKTKRTSGKRPPTPKQLLRAEKAAMRQANVEPVHLSGDDVCVCRECGALVWFDRIADHAEFHGRVQEQ